MDWGKLWHRFRSSFNFYRTHLTFFTFTPLIFAAIFYASNGEFHISFIDSLFNCVSAMTVTGLTTVDLSSLTGWQQTILFLLQCMGNIVTVSWFMVYVRRRFFAKRFDHIAASAINRKAARANGDIEPSNNPLTALTRVFTRSRDRPVVIEQNEHSNAEKKSRKAGLQKLRPDMIRRVNDIPKLVDPSGWVSHGPSNTSKKVNHSTPPATSSSESEKTTAVETSAQPTHQTQRHNFSNGPPNMRPSQDRVSHLRDTSPPRINSHGFPLSHTLSMGGRAETIEFATPPVPNRILRTSGVAMSNRVSSRRNSQASNRPYPTVIDERYSGPGHAFPPYRSATMHTHRSQRPTMNKGFGGFPGPQTVLIRLIRRFVPQLEQKFVRTVTIPRTTTILSTSDAGNRAPYVTFDAIVGRNSKFHGLTQEHLEELGGVEYRALTALLWIVGGYHIGVQLVSFIVIAPYISTSRWRSDFEPPQLHRYVPPAWFAAFQVVSAYTNAGMSLVDQSMTPFQQAYPMIVFLIFPILAGNTAFPIFLRFTIWIITKVAPLQSRTNETLHFLLDHPRRCFVYLFPSHQTWFLLTVVLSLTVTDWFFFLVLDIGNPAIEVIPVGVRVLLGLLQATAVRAAGFATVSLSTLAPAVQVLYVLMMYVSVYPIALSVRSTNVYEERSLGVFDDENEFEEPSSEGSRVHVWGRYIAWHARKQLAFDMWWIALALFLICIIEKSQIEDENNLGWFTIFRLVFELVSAYGTVGLSLGVPYANYSFSGAFTPLSKLIVCAVMIRGRHRGLPVAIDRAVLLPFEYGKTEGSENVDRGETAESTDDGVEQNNTYASTRMESPHNEF